MTVLFYSCACAVLYRLLVRLTNSQIAAYHGTIGFLINPANIFFTACYTESIYFCFFISAIYCLCEREPRPWLSAVFLFLASATRSNGFINVGFILHFTIHAAVAKIYRKSSLCEVSFIIMCGVVQSFIVILPYIAFQCYAWFRYCHSAELCMASESLDCLTADHEWCSSTVPSIYSYIQVKYWDNGLFNYWQAKKIPLFILATPTIVICLRTLRKTVVDLSIGVMKSDFFGFRSAEAGLPWAGAPMQICCWVHLTILSVFAILFMNIEVITRLVWSSSPLVYIYAAQIIQHSTVNRRRKFLLGYSFLYSTAGVLLHSNFYPWT